MATVPATSSPAAAGFLGDWPSATAPDATIKRIVKATPYARFIVVLLKRSHPGLNPRPNHFAVFGAGKNFIGNLFFRQVWIHHDAGRPPASILLDDHSKHIELAVQTFALAVVAFDCGVIGQNRHVPK